MRIGIHSFSGGASLEEQLRVATDAEDQGFDSCWFGHIFGHDALTLATLAGQRTERIEIGTAVAQSYARHPFVLAQQALTIQAAAGGRFTLGVGPSHKVLIQDMWGMPYEQVATHFREYLSVLRSLVDQGQVSFSGEKFRVVGGLQIPDRKPCPIVVAALGPMMLQIAGELADGTVTWMTGPKTVKDHIVPRINAAAEAAGRPKPRVCVGLPVAVTDDVPAAREAAAKAFEMYGQLPNYRRVLDREGAAGPEDVAVVGNEAEVEAQVRAMAEAGATDFMTWTFPVGEDARASLDRTWSLMKSLVGKV